MKYLTSIIEELRKGVSRGLRVTKEDVSSSLIELVDETSVKHIEVLGKPVVRTLDIKPIRPWSTIYALDTSSRVVETPYVFIGISAGSIYNRFTGYGIDVPSTGSILGLDQPLCNHIILVPEVELDPSSLINLGKVPGVVLTNPLGLPYTSEYNKSIMLVELRLGLENCLLQYISKIKLESEKLALFVDGPLLYSLSIPLEGGAFTREKLKTYTESLKVLNSRRANILESLLSKGLVIGIVKRLIRSYYLASVDPVNLSVGKINDEAYISTMLMKMSYSLDRPLIVGPLHVKHDVTGVDRVMWYIVTPRRLYPFSSGMGNYVVYRAEVFSKSYIDENEVLNYVFYDSVYTGSLLPLSVLVVDRRVKKISSSLVTYILYMTGLSEDSTNQYISIL